MDVKPFLYGSHLHYLDMPPCTVCDAENDAFMALMKQHGAEVLEQRVQRMQLTREYNQHWPYDQWSHVNTLEGAYVERGTSVFSGREDISAEEALADREAVDEWLAELPDTQKHIMKRTAQGYKPREIAAQLGHENSAMVRLNKHEARKALGAPINPRMRRKRAAK